MGSKGPGTARPRIAVHRITHVSRGLGLGLTVLIGVAVLAVGLSDRLPADALLLLFAIPITLLALELGLASGLAAGAAGFAIFCGWALAEGGAGLTPVGCVLRGLALLATGALVGYIGARRRAVVTAVEHEVDELTRTEQELKRSTSLLEATLESTADGILVVDPQGRMTSFNRRFGELWQLPAEILESRDDQHALQFVLDQLAHPKAFIAKVQEVYDQPDAESFDELDFKDGRVFERYSQPQRIGSEVVGRVWSFRDVTARRYSEQKVAYLAHHDELTGLPNRLMFQEHLGLGLARARRHGTAMALLYVDLDRFKLINDSLGHAAGDHVLRQIAERLRSVMRAEDLVARHSGDEFLILLSGLETGNAGWTAGMAAGKLHHALDQAFELEHEFFVDASIGIATYPADADDADGLLRAADIAMYQSKRAGPGGTRVFSQGAGVDPAARLALPGRLRHALERGEFVLHYQPVLRLGSARDEDGRREGPLLAHTEKVEALLRWNHPEQGLVVAADFVPLAEEAGMMDVIDEWVMVEVCRQARAFADQGIEVPIAFNLSAREFGRPGLINRLGGAIDAAGALGPQLIVEITESAATRDAHLTRRQVGALRERGLRVSIDDFGIGYSSLSRLLEARIDSLKIDRSFMARLPGDKRTCAMVDGVIQLARGMGIRPIAEGIETEQQWDFLVAHGCTLGQGHLFSPALPPDELATTDLVPAYRSANERTTAS